MKLCSNKHEEVCYEEHTDCPVCTLKDEIKDLENQIEGLEAEVDTLKDELSEARQEK